MFTDAKLYVGTYRKYNNGSLFGEWITLSDFSDKDEFLAYCRQLHSDENDPEFMFQDYEGLPSSLYCESYIDAKVWDVIDALADMDDDTAELFGEWMEHHCYDINEAADRVQQFEDEHCGDYSQGFTDPLKNYADEIAPDFLGISYERYEAVSYYIDLDAIARALDYDGYFEINGHIFRPAA